MLVTGDVLVPTWDLARAAGLDERLDEGVVAETLTGMEPVDEVLRASGHYGPKIDVDHDADTQTRLLAFTGRHPGAVPPCAHGRRVGPALPEQWS